LCLLCCGQVLSSIESLPVIRSDELICAGSKS
jgi:hypothetical protein